MKRLTIEVDSCDPAEGVTRFVANGEAYYLPSRLIVAVEDAPLPLPTEPGERFWGSFDKTAPCWWFVRTERGTEGVWYVSQHVDRGARLTGINSTSIVAVEGRLVRLPDPEAAP